MRTDYCREWRESLGAYSLGHLQGAEREAFEAHLEGCPECQTEVESLRGIAELLPKADPVHLDAAPQPAADLGRKIMAAVAGEQKREKRRRRRQLTFGAAGGFATAVAILLLVVIPSTAGTGGTSQDMHVQFASLPKGVEMKAMVEPGSYGTQIHMYVNGIRSGTLCSVFVKAHDGAEYAAGSFRYRYGTGGDVEAVLSSGVDISHASAIEVRAGGQTYVAHLGETALEGIGAGDQT
jgi:hypothetical protein